MAPLSQWLDKAGEKLFDGGEYVKRSLETRVQDLKEVIEDIKDDPTATRDRLLSESQQRAKGVGNWVTDEFKDARDDPLKYGRQILSLSPFLASQTSSASLEPPPDEYMITYHGGGDLPPAYAEYLSSQEKPCPVCRKLSMNAHVPLLELRRRAESELCWVCLVLWQGLVADELYIKRSSGIDSPLEKNGLEVYCRLWRAFELVLQERTEDPKPVKHGDPEPTAYSRLEFYSREDRTC